MKIKFKLDIRNLSLKNKAVILFYALKASEKSEHNPYSQIEKAFMGSADDTIQGVLKKTEMLDYHEQSIDSIIKEAMEEVGDKRDVDTITEIATKKMRDNREYMYDSLELHEQEKQDAFALMKVAFASKARAKVTTTFKQAEQYLKEKKDAGIALKVHKYEGPGVSYSVDIGIDFEKDFIDIEEVANNIGLDDRNAMKLQMELVKAFDSSPHRIINTDQTSQQLTETTCLQFRSYDLATRKKYLKKYTNDIGNKATEDGFSVMLLPHILALKKMIKDEETKGIKPKPLTESEKVILTEYYTKLIESKNTVPTTTKIDASEPSSKEEEVSIIGEENSLDQE